MSKKKSKIPPAPRKLWPQESQIVQADPQAKRIKRVVKLPVNVRRQSGEEIELTAVDEEEEVTEDVRQILEILGLIQSTEEE